MATLDQLRALGLDVDEGLACCAQDEDFYREMLGEFAAEGERGAQKLAAGLAAGDWGSYALCAHSLKSTSRMIGAAALSEQARALEAAARVGDAAAIRAGHAAFLSALTALCAALR